MATKAKKQIELSGLQQSLQRQLKRLKETKKLRNNELAAMLGRSEGTISDILNGKKSYSDKLVSQMLGKLNDYGTQGDLVPTRQLQQMRHIAESCKKASDMRLIVGNTGIGKSVVMKQIAKETGHVYYFKTDRRYSWNKLLVEVARIMGLRFRTTKGKEKKRVSTNDLLDAIIAKVEQTAGANPLLIIDESEVLSNGIYKHIKNLYTATEGLLGIIIVGITEVKSRIARISGLDADTWFPVTDDSNQYTTFARRLKVHRIPNIGFDAKGVHDIDRYCAAKGIESKEAVELARQRWWNYEEAERAVKRAKGFGFDLKNLTKEEFELL